MKKMYIPVIVAIIGLIPIIIGGAATNWSFQIGDNTVITDNSNTETNYINSVTGEAIGEAALIITCLMNPIPEGFVAACAER